MKITQKIDQSIYYIEFSILLISMILTLGLSLLQIILRTVFNTGFLWVDPLVRYLVIAFCLFGASLGFRNDRYIGLEVITNFISKKYKKIVKIITYLVTLTVLYFLIQASIEFIPIIKEEDVPLIFNISKWYFALIIPIGFSMILVRIVLRIIDLMTSHAKGREID